MSVIYSKLNIVISPGQMASSVPRKGRSTLVSGTLFTTTA